MRLRSWGIWERCSGGPLPVRSGEAMSDFGEDGDLGAGLARMAYGVAATGVVVWLWQIVLRRLSTRAASNSRVRTVSEAASLVPESSGDEAVRSTSRRAKNSVTCAAILDSGRRRWAW